MFHNFKARLNFLKFNISIKSILDTPPIECDPDDSVVCVSQVCHRDIFAYLLAIKSFVRFLSPKKVYVLDDLSMTMQDKKLIREHVKEVEIIPITDIENTICPTGGTWERLLFISDCAKDNYVIQLDSDTLTVDTIPEVINSVKENRGFTLGTWRGQEIEPMKETCKNVKSSNSNHIQIITEKNYDKLPDYAQLSYVRGCSAFAGFPRGAILRPKVEHFSQEMEAIIGPKWSNWGSEQVTSNFIIDNSIPSMVLPYPKYAGFRP
ncbi:hypothetical protein KA005_05460, partial [bacterium]|nr:hypothetical protein [bacterium]